jgi:hypothetical protein
VESSSARHIDKDQPSRDMSRLRRTWAKRNLALPAESQNTNEEIGIAFPETNFATMAAQNGDSLILLQR